MLSLRCYHYGRMLGPNSGKAGLERMATQRRAVKPGAAVQRARLELILSGVKARGFDQSYMARGFVRVRCSECEAVVINGMPTHEQGCRNLARYRCRECGQSHTSMENAFYCCNEVTEYAESI